MHKFLLFIFVLVTAISSATVIRPVFRQIKQKNIKTVETVRLSDSTASQTVVVATPTASQTVVIATPTAELGD